MKILVLNCGSSSIKYKLFDMDSKEVMAQGGIERIGLQGSFLKFALPNGEKVILEREIPEHTVGIEFVLETLTGEKYGEVIGVHILGNPGSEMIYGACMAIENEMTIDEMKEIVFPHPTVSEIFKETLFAF